METQDKILIGLGIFAMLGMTFAPKTTSSIVHSLFFGTPTHPCPHGLIAVHGKKNVYCLACSQQIEKLPRGRDLNRKKEISCS
jgi:hypothetical protein